ncbi:hypothetical protein BJF79_32360 [Actinomadura sp. CNU-125]|uniref:hypothetical protein n=1 Tax=Actinomadura sp. CNU-125 TaxID=1904961 RepID=UPI000968F30E|nr:hypothetical protein [Actinomadura sp. CNU-125]OLT35453.1 hypothetical protein BJF79_32360 [Actinomadura sp. CNU-125]
MGILNWILGVSPDGPSSERAVTSGGELTGSQKGQLEDHGIDPREAEELTEQGISPAQAVKAVIKRHQS